MSTQRVTFLVHGTVQGVFFRAYTQTSAQKHNLTGFVYNTKNGKVAGEAQGKADDIKNLLKDLDRGSPGSHVIRVDKTDKAELVENEDGFTIRKGSFDV